MNRRTFSLETHRRCATTTKPPLSLLIKRAVRGSHFSLGKSKPRGAPVFLELRAALLTPRRRWAPWPGDDDTAAWSRHPQHTLAAATSISNSSGRMHGGLKGHRRKNAHAAVFYSFFIQLLQWMQLFFFSFFFLDLLNWKLAVEDIASVIISEWRRRFLWTKQYIKVMHHRWINSCQWTLHNK